MPADFRDLAAVRTGQIGINISKVGMGNIILYRASAEWLAGRGPLNTLLKCVEYIVIPVSLPAIVDVAAKIERRLVGILYRQSIMRDRARIIIAHVFRSPFIVAAAVDG